MSSDGDNVSHIESWTAEEVSAFLAGLELAQYDDDFAENGITGDILVHLDHEALKDIGVVSVGHRLAILRKVYDLKIRDGVQIEPEHFVPASASGADTLEAPASLTDVSKDLLTITSAIQQRDERLAASDAEVKRLSESLAKLKEQLAPIFKMAKEMQPLPTPDLSSPAQAIPRKFSTKKLFLGSAPKQISPTHPPAQYFYGEPESPRSPSRTLDSPALRSQTPAGIASTQHLEVVPPRLPPPPRPPPPGSSYSASPNSTPSSSSKRAEEHAAAASAAAMDAFKSFRVGLDDPCSKVLPAALKKYKINSDWREYSLFICYQDQERCLGLDEKPLLVFQELQRANKSPVFMLRKQNGQEEQERF
ncbi:hypothetical protein BCR37DRAFT_383572 [Protomyces lactucae-debilis]|uniref:SAM domain-containing protein n=1 Tax=Protomyces lactucae-debilis TaxID=2754530 RepID=A0A1Y2EWN0_PROLT|nr:uncharacterized protein BCR37DRAFT_383572 [Protomyces lactucae-debilis]ORY76021.1 hypothetical protein BCR37DRAFT_383572 [Protomyces lactucae-debilis]